MAEKNKETLEYKKNMVIVKHEFAKIAATALPLIREYMEKSDDVLKFFLKLITESKNIESEKLFTMILDKVADKLATDQERLMEILTYMTSLTPEEMNKILIHSMVETMPKVDK